MLLFLAVVLGLALRGMTPEQRLRLLRAIVTAIRFARDAVMKTPAGCEAFHEALRARTRWVFVTPALVAASVTIFVFMVGSGADVADPRTLVDWGASIGPRTTNGEWWRLATAMFVHWGLLHLFVNIAGLLQAGLLMERLVGSLAFVVVVAASGILAGLWALSAHPVSVSAGAGGAIFGVYGLALASLVWGLIQRSTLTIPFAALRALWPGVALFVVYDTVAEGLASESMQAGLVVGFVSGIVVAGRVTVYKPPLRRVCAGLAATVAIVAISAAPLRGLADVTGELARVTEAEARTAGAYDAAVARFKSGRLTAEGLADIADRIASELHVLMTRVKALDNVPTEHQRVLAAASEYLRLREESWRLRGRGLRAGHIGTLQQADGAEMAALAVFRATVSPPAQ